MKKLLLLLFLCLPFAFTSAQDITADTICAKAFYAEAKALQNKSHYDSALLLYRQALPLYKKHELWERYYTCGKDQMWCLMSLRQIDSATFLGKYYLKETKKRLPELSRAKADLFYILGFAYHNQSQYRKALEFYQKSQGINLEMLGEKHANVASTYNSMAIVYQSQAQYDKALKFYQKSVSIFVELLGEKRISVANIYNNMANVYYYQSQYPNALKYYEKSLSIFVELLGQKTHPGVARAYHNIAGIHSMRSRYTNALKYYEKSLSIFIKLLGKKNAEVANTYNNMAIVYKNQSQYKKALEFYQKSLSIYLELLGEKHISVAMIYDNLGLLYRDLKQYNSAAYFHHKAVKAVAQSFESPDLNQNPKPEQAMEKNTLMEYLQHKAQVLTLLGQEENALKAYAVAAACANLAMFEAQREEDKLDVAARVHPVHTQAAYLHFLRGKRNNP